MGLVLPADEGGAAAVVPPQAAGLAALPVAQGAAGGVPAAATPQLIPFWFMGDSVMNMLGIAEGTAGLAPLENTAAPSSCCEAAVGAGGAAAGESMVVLLNKSSSSAKAEYLSEPDSPPAGAAAS